MKILGVDPSSTRTGYAVMTSPEKILDAGYLRPAKTDDPPLDRIMVMAGDLLNLIDEFCPRLVIIETTSGKVGSRRHGGGGSGLGVYGMAVGAMYALVWFKHQPRLQGVLENDWTRGTPKGVRRRNVALAFPEHAAVLRNDTGGDVADAIGLCCWWFARERERDTV